MFHLRAQFKKQGQQESSNHCTCFGGALVKSSVAGLRFAMMISAALASRTWPASGDMCTRDWKHACWYM